MDRGGDERRGTDEEDAIEVFELAEKDGDEGVTLYVVDVPFLEEDVGFVEEEYGFPRDGILEDLLQLDLQLLWLGTQVSATDGEKRTLLFLCHAFFCWSAGFGVI